MKKNVIILFVTTLVAICIVVAIPLVWNNMTNNGTPSTDVTYTSGVLAELTMDEIAQSSTLVVTGKFNGNKDCIMVETANLNAANFTNNGFVVENVLRGNASVGDIITVRTDGGSVGENVEINEHSPVFSEGDEYLLFLYNPGPEYIFNTEDEHYFVVGVNQGAFKLLANDKTLLKQKVYGGKNVNTYTEETVKTADTLTAKPYNAVITLDSFKSDMASYNVKNPINKNYNREKQLENAKKNFENGVITKEEYNAVVKGKYEYAKIVKRETK